MGEITSVIKTEKKNFGLSIDNVIGDVINGVLTSPKQLTEINFKGVTDIDNHALENFFRESNITSISFPDLTTITGQYAMQYCCYNCKNLTSIDFSKLTRLGGYSLYYAFAGCDSLVSVNMDNLIRISNQGLLYAFQDCINLETVSMKNVTSFANSGGIFKNCTSLKNVDITSATFISTNMFENCTSLESIDISSCKTIASDAFSGCTSLKTVICPNVTSVGNGGFENCTSLENLDLNKVTSMNGAEFYNCTFLKTINLNSLKSIGFGSSFYNCQNLETITYGESSWKANSNLINYFYNCQKLESIPTLVLDYSTDSTNSKKTISMRRCFYNCQNLDLGDFDLSGLEYLNNNPSSIGYAFYNCKKLTSLDLSNLEIIKLTWTGNNAEAFKYVCCGCSSLTSIDLSKLSLIDASAALTYSFAYCTSLQTLSFPSLNSNSFGSYTNQFENMLKGVTGCTVHFPSNLQSVIGSWSDVTRGFGGTNTTILFDLPATS